MAYYLGKDVGVVLTTEDATHGVTVAVASNVYTVASADPGATIGPLTNPNFDTSTGLVSNLTGVDVGIGSTDEDVVFMGANTPLKAEIHKETTVTLTKKKNSAAFDVMFSGDEDGTLARYGVKNDNSLYGGLEQPGSDYYYSFGYRIFIALKSGSEILAIRNAQMTSHTVSLNADGTQEETIEFTSQVNPKIFHNPNDDGIDTATTAGDF